MACYRKPTKKPVKCCARKPTTKSTKCCAKKPTVRKTVKKSQPKKVTRQRKTQSPTWLTDWAKSNRAADIPLYKMHRKFNIGDLEQATRVNRFVYESKGYDKNDWDYRKIKGNKWEDQNHRYDPYDDEEDYILTSKELVSKLNRAYSTTQTAYKKNPNSERVKRTRIRIMYYLG